MFRPMFRAALLATCCALMMFPACKKAATKETKTTTDTKITDVTKVVVVTGGGGTLTVPANSLLVNTTVKMEAVPAPGTFTAIAAAAPGASKAVAVTATVNGAAVATSTLPMTLALTLSSTSLLAGATAENVCVLAAPLAAPTKLYFWRRAQLTMESNTFKVETRFFGTYQLAYCGIDPVSTGVEQVKMNAVYAAIQGRWVKACSPSSATQDYTVKTATFSNWDVTHEAAHHSASTCDATNLLYTVRISATHDVQGAATSPSGAQNTRWLITGVTITPAAAGVSSLAGNCGITTWASGVAVDVLNKTPCPIGGAWVDTHWYYDLAYTAGTQLLFGASLGSTEAERPQTLSAEQFVKQ